MDNPNESLLYRRNQAIQYIEIDSYTIYCDKCNNLILEDNCWFVPRWSSGMTTKGYHYCVNCLSSKGRVRNEIDTDKIMYGIAGADNYFNFNKTSSIKNEEFVESLFAPLLKRDDIVDGTALGIQNANNVR